MASIAFLLCTTYVVFLLFVDNRASRGTSLALWVPTIWTMIAASRPLAIWFTTPGQGTYANDSGSPVDRWTLIGLAAIAIIVLTMRSAWSGPIWRNKWVFVFLGYMLLSTLWSDVTLLAMKRWIREGVVILMAMLVASEANPKAALLTVFRRSAYILIPFSLLLIKYFPVYGRQYGRYSGIELWIGVTEQKNQLGRLCMIGSSFLLLELYLRWRDRKIGSDKLHLWASVSIGALGVYLLLGSNSATSLATMLAGTAMFLSLRWLGKRNVIVPLGAFYACMLFLICNGTVAPFVGGANLRMITAPLDRDSTLTGRTDVWASVLPARSERPLLGYGIGSFWTDERRHLYEIPTAHNGYLDVLLDLGEVGLVLCVIWVFSCARQFHRTYTQDPDWANFSMCLLLIVLMYNVTESSLNSLTDFMTAVIVITVFAVPKKPLTQNQNMLSARFRIDKFFSDFEPENRLDPAPPDASRPW